MLSNLSGGPNLELEPLRCNPPNILVGKFLFCSLNTMNHPLFLWVLQGALVFEWCKKRQLYMDVMVPDVTGVLTPAQVGKQNARGCFPRPFVALRTHPSR